MFCTACPAAPFTRLSMAEVTTTWPKASAAVTWQWFVPMTSWVRGWSAVAWTKGSAS